jgi:hypothetical protein
MNDAAGMAQEDDIGPAESHRPQWRGAGIRNF